MRRLSHSSTALAAAALAALTLTIGACGSSGSGPTVNPTPFPTATPTPTPDPNVPPVGSGCGEPYPPQITRFQVKIHAKDRDWWELDSTPLVGHDAAYCASIGFTDGRSICPLRPEGHAERYACEMWRIGVARDTGQVGPTWTFIGKDGQQSYCSNAPEAPCRHWDGNPFKVKAIKGGLYRVCSELGACGEVDVDRNL
jgi:hypothetical protein